ncbi:MAG TPA: aminotransferase class V-fold PLP-dependent enzyme [Hyphomonadaceae bacterium]|nr:aminotransferase class V-fold PLP-dependent enzyme [Hyphomonadaceae bacterium]
MAKPPQSRRECEALDMDDPLQHARKAFVLPEKTIYLDGHSLGPATHEAIKRVNHAAAQEWAQGLIRSWNDAGGGEGWIDLPLRVGQRIAGLIGAQPDEVIVADSVSVNLFKLAAAAMDLAGTKTLLVEESEFPTDQYVAEGPAGIKSGRLKRVGADQAISVLAKECVVLIKSVVNYRTALVADIAAHEKAAAKTGSVIVWDLSHAAGVLELDLAEQGAWLAAGCTYKFLNGGPGAPAYLYVRGDLAEKLSNPIAGWMGHASPFAFDPGYAPRAGVARFAAGTPGILSLSALDGALDAFNGTDIRLVERKARALGDLVLARTKAMGLEAISPTDPSRRGGHVSVRHPDGYAVVQALIARGVIADFRAPDCMRFGVSPLFLRYADVWDAMDALANVLTSAEWDKPEFKTRAAVT